MNRLSPRCLGKSLLRTYQPRTNIIRAVKLADVLYQSVPHPTKERRTRKIMSSPPPGSPPHQRTLDNGIIVQLMHHPDDTVALPLPQFRKGYWLTARKPGATTDLYPRDSPANRVRDL